MSTRRPVTAEDLRILNLPDLDPEEIQVRIDPDDMEPPNWAKMPLEDGIQHRQAMREKYNPDELADIDHAVVAALLERNEHPTMRRRRREMRERL